MRRLNCNLLLGIGLALGGCGSSYPLDMPESEWKAMSPQERIDARQMQADLEKAREKRRAKEAEAREAEARKRAEELAKARREADYGERVQCVFKNVKAYMGGDWRSVTPVAMDLVTGGEFEIELAEPREGGLNYSTEAYVDFDGQTVRICDRREDRRRYDDRCARMLGTFKDYERGLRETVQGPDFVRGRLRCELVPKSYSGGDIIIER